MFVPPAPRSGTPSDGACGPAPADGPPHPVLFRIPSIEPADPDLLIVAGSIGRHGPHRLLVIGDLCTYTMPLLATYLETQEPLTSSDVVLDTSRVTFVDSTGIAGCLAMGE